MSDRTSVIRQTIWQLLSPQLSKSRRFFSNQNFVRFSCAAILLVASILKTIQIAIYPVSTTIFGSRLVLVGLIECELSMSLWLIAGLCPVWSRRVGIATFAVFVISSGYSGLLGAESCGCFGPVHVNPWLSCVMDIVLVALLYNWKPTAANNNDVRNDYKLRTLWIVLALVVAVINVIIWKTWQLSDSTGSVDDQSVVILEPQEWLGKTFPLEDQIDIGRELARGSWVVLFYHPDCPLCQKAIVYYEHVREELKRSQSGTDVALIQVPPFADDVLLSHTTCRRGKLTDSKEWFITTPSAVTIREGRVLSVATGTDVLLKVDNR